MFSKDLEVSIANLFDKAQEINIQYLTVEHLFLMILNDYDVKDFIDGQNVSVDALKDELNEHLKKSRRKLVGNFSHIIFFPSLLGQIYLAENKRNCFDSLYVKLFKKVGIFP